MTRVDEPDVALVRRYQRGNQRDEAIGTEGGKARRNALDDGRWLEPVGVRCLEADFTMPVSMAADTPCPETSAISSAVRPAASA